MARGASTATSIVARAAESGMDARAGDPDNNGRKPKGRDTGIWAALKALWQRTLQAIERWPTWVRWLVSLAGAGLAALAGTLGLTNAGAGIKILFSQGPSAFWTYLQRQPFGPFAVRFPVVFVLIVLVGLAIIRLAAIIRKQNEDRAQFKLVERAASEAIRKGPRLSESELSQKLREYLEQLCKQYDTLGLPSMAPLRLSEVALDLPLVRTYTLGAPLPHVGRSAANSTPADGGAPSQGASVPAFFESLRTRTIPVDSIAQIHSRPRRIIVVGGPDSGKSTLLKLQAIRIARGYLDAMASGQQPTGDIPIYLTAPDIVEAGALDVAVTKMLKQLINEPLLSAHLMREMRNGRALVCIDSLEAVDSTRRMAIAESLAAEKVHNETTVLMASRANEPPSSPLLRAGFKEWALQDLTAVPNDNSGQDGALTLRQQLAVRLFAAFDRTLGVQQSERPKTDGAADSSAPAKSAADGFIKALDADRHAASWRGNPLLFSVAAAIDFVDGHLPPNQVEMYRRLFEETQRGAGDDNIERRLSRRVLANLALWLYRQNWRVLNLDDLLTFLVESEHETPHGAARMGESLLHESVLAQAAGGRLSFRYDAFVEYLAAVALAQNVMSRDRSRRDDTNRALLDDFPLAQWRDALVLLPSVLVQEYGRQGEDAARVWLRTLLRQADTAAGDPAATGLELAVDSLEALGSVPRSLTDRGIGDDIGAAWVAELRQAAIYGHGARESQLLALTTRITHIGEQPGDSPAAASGVGQAAGQKVQALFGDPHPRVREVMARAILALGEHVRTQEIEDVLLGSAERDARATAARILWALPPETEGRREALSRALDDDFWAVRFLALTALGAEASAEDVDRALRGVSSPAVRLAANARISLDYRVGPSGWMGTLLRAQWRREGLDFADERPTVRTCAAGIGLESLGVLLERQFGDVAAAFSRSASAAQQEMKAIAAPEQAAEINTPPPAQSEVPGAPEQQAAGEVDPGEQARQAAVGALRSLGILNEDTLAALRQATGDSNIYVRAAAGLVLGLLALIEAIASNQAGDPAASLGDKTSVTMRVAALVWLSLVEDDPTAMLREHLDDAAPAVRLTIVLLLGLIASDASNETESAQLKALLVEETHDPSLPVAVTASVMLSAVVPPISREALLRGLSSPSSVTTRYVTMSLMGLLGALRKLDGPVQALDIANALGDEKRWDLSLWAGLVTEWLRHRQQLSGDTPLELFSAPLRQDEPAARLIGVAALGFLGFVGDQDEHALTALLIDATSDQAAAVAVTALVSLAALELADKLTQPLPEGDLLRALSHRNAPVRLTAIAVLAELALTGRISRPALAERLGRMAGHDAAGEPSALVRAAAVVALAELGSRDTGRSQTRILEQLDGALDDPSSWWVRVSAAVGWISAAQRAPGHKVARVLGTDQHVWVRFGTAVMLAVEHDPDELRKLLIKLSAADSNPAQVLAHSLRHLRRLGRKDPLLGALHDRTLSTRRRAAMILAALDGLRLVLTESDQAVRDVAVLGLGALSLIQRAQDVQRGERRPLGIEGWLRSLLRSSAQDTSISDLAKQLRELANKLRKSEGIAHVVQQVRKSGRLVPPGCQVARLLGASTHWLVASAAAVELGLFGALDCLEPENAQRIADALHDTRLRGQQWVRMVALLVLNSPLMNDYEPRTRPDDVDEVVRELLAQIEAAGHIVQQWLSALVPVRGLMETTRTRIAWLRAASVWVQGVIAARSATMREHLPVSHLLELAQDKESAAVRWAAVSALRQLGEAVHAAQLRNLLANEPRPMIRASIVDAIDARGQEVGAEVFEMALDDPDWSVRVEAVAALRKRQGLAGLQRALQDTNPAVRVAAATALATEAQHPKSDPLLAAFGDVDAYLAALGIRTIGMSTHGSATAAANALRELGQHVPPSWAAALMDRGGDKSFQGTASVQWLGFSESLLDLLEEGLRSPSARVRAITACALGMLHDPRADAAVRRCAEQDHDAMVLDVAAGMLARRAGTAPSAERTEEPQGVLLDVLFVLGLDLQTGISTWLRELSAGGGSAISQSLAQLAASLINPTVSMEMLERVAALLDPTGQAAVSRVQVKAAEALSRMQPPAAEQAIRAMLTLRRDLGDKDELNEEETAWLVALDDALRLVLRPSAPAPIANQSSATG